jgi:hypothetical protein
MFHIECGVRGFFMANLEPLVKRVIVSHSFEPVDGGGEAINISSSATRSSQLDVGKTYHVTAEADCYWTVGGSSVDATTSDYFLREGVYLEYTPTSGKDYISVIRKSVDVAGGFHICEVG